MYPHREVFPSAPLALVAGEIRFSDVARLRQQETRDAIAMALEARFPVVRSISEVNVHIDGPAAAQVHDRSAMMFTDEAGVEAITVTAGSLIYETTSYTDFAQLASAIDAGCRALAGCELRPAMQRIGLRYIDEVRVPQPITDPRQWATWIDRRLTDQLEIGPDSADPVVTQGENTYDLGGGTKMTMRYAALNQGPVVTPRFLHRQAYGPGPFFVLDFDGFREFATGPAQLLDAAEVERTLTAVHAPCGAAFQRSITDTARELFRKEKR